MKLRRIEIRAFGVLENFRLDLTDGGQAFYALNESGKSTCLAFVRCALYGMPRRTDNLHKSLRDRYLPFDMGYAEGSLIFEHAGAVYRLRRRFGKTPASDTTECRDETTGDELRLQSPGAPGVELLGLERGAFVNTVYVAQMELPYAKDEDKTGALIKHLTDLGSTGETESSVTGLKNRLVEAERRLNSTQRTSSFIPELKSQLERLLAEEREARLARAQADARAAEMTELERRLERTETELTALRSLQAAERQAAQTAERIARTQAAKERLEALERSRRALEGGSGFEHGAGSRRLAARMAELRSRQDGQYARWKAHRPETEETDEALLEAAETAKRLYEAVRAQQRRAEQATPVYERSLVERRDLQTDLDRLTKKQKSLEAEDKAQLAAFQQAVREAEAAERKAHDAVREEERKLREEGFTAERQSSSALKDYRAPYQRSLELDEAIRALQNEEEELLRYLEGEAGEAVKTLRTEIAAYETARMEFLLGLEPLPEDERKGEESRPEEPGNDPQRFPGPAAGDSLGDSCPEAEHERLAELCRQATTERRSAEQKLEAVRRDYYAKNSEVEHMKGLISEVVPGDGGRLVLWAAATGLAVLAGILSLAWTLRAEPLFLLPAAAFFALAAWTAFRFRLVLSTRRLAETMRERKRTLIECERLAAELERKAEEAEALVETWRERERERSLAYQRSSLLRAERRETAARYKERLRNIRQQKAGLLEELAGLEERLPGLGRKYKEEAAACRARIETLNERLEEARNAHKRCKEAADKALAAMEAAEAEVAAQAEGEDRLRLQAEMIAVIEALTEKERAIAEQSEAVRKDREALEARLKEAGFSDGDAVEAKYGDLRDQLRSRTRRRQEAETEARQMIGDLRALEDEWSRLGDLGRSLYDSSGASASSAEPVLEEAARLFSTTPDFSVLVNFAGPSEADGEASGESDACGTCVRDELKGTMRRTAALDFLERLKDELERRESAQQAWRHRCDRLRTEIEAVRTELPPAERTAERKAALASLEAEIAYLREEAGLDAAVGTALAAETEDFPEGAIRECERQVRELTARVSSLRSLLEHDEYSLPEEIMRQRFAVEEELELREQQLAAVRLAQRAAARASKELRARFSPTLQSYASGYLARITSGRYSRLIVLSEGSDMMLRVYDEEAGREFEGERLSGAAFEQIHLALRLGMVRILDPEHRLPLLFDDILVQFDEERERACVELFDDLVKEGRQIIYFTCSEALAERLRRTAPSWRIRPLLEG